jgi:ubiquinone biosynthesis monooxygenase Coq7
VDKIIEQVDIFLRTIMPPDARSISRNINWKHSNNTDNLSKKQQKEIAGLMRVNHCGEVCAQALYMGQAATAKLPDVAEHMQQAAIEETDHLAWCEQRLKDFASHPSILNPLWYIGSWMIGALAGFCGDRWSLGFVVETERQVGAHLASHIAKLPAEDLHTKEILAIMMADEAGHAEVAKNSGARELPPELKWLMQVSSKVMTTISYYL